MADSEPRITVAICTHNRKSYLPKAIESICSQDLDPDTYEVLIVDNASSDGTGDFIRQNYAEYPNLRYVYEPNLGISWARNRSIAEAKSPYILYIDDDARLNPGSLSAVLDDFEHLTPAPVAIGGKIWLDWEGERPDWVPERYLNIFTFLDYGDRAFYLEEDHYLMGANLAFDVRALKKLGGFNPDLGRIGGKLRSGEETALVNLMLSLNMPVYYEPASSVWHVVPPARKKKQWLWRRFYWDGASQPLLMNDMPDQLGGKLHLLLFEIKQIGKFFIYVLYHKLSRNNQPEMLVVYRMCIAQRIGRARTRFMLIWRSLFKKKRKWSSPEVRRR